MLWVSDREYGFADMAGDRGGGCDVRLGGALASPPQWGGMVARRRRDRSAGDDAAGA